MEHHADLGPELHWIHLAVIDVPAVKANIAFDPAGVDGVVHAVETAKKRGLATTTWPDQCGHFAIRNIHADIEQCLLLPIPEIDFSRRHAAVGGIR